MASDHSELLEIIASQSSPLDPLPTELAPRLACLKGIRAVVFDIYGTLFISGSGDISLARDESRASTLRSVMEDSGIVWPDDAPGDVGKALTAMIRASHAEDRGRGVDFPEVEIRDIWTGLLRSVGANDSSPSEIEALTVRHETRVNPVWPMPGLGELLALLRGRTLSLGIISNAQFYTPLLFEHFLGHPPPALGFDEELCVWSYQERRGKPSRALFDISVRALELRGMRPDEILYVGNDMRNDIVPAASVGMRTALFAGDARSLRLREYSADAIPADLILTRLDQLPGCIE